jgi:cytochrome P450
MVRYEACEEVLRNLNVSVDQSDFIADTTPWHKLNSLRLKLFMSTILMKGPPVHTRLRRLVNRDQADLIKSFCTQ